MTDQDILWDALVKLPKPVTKDSILKTAQDVVPAKAQQFSQWLETHENYLLQRLNNG
jgi:hypothetical protein